MRLPAVARSLSARLLVLTTLFVMLAEVLIFVPSAARFRLDWLSQRLAYAHIAALSVEAAPENMVTPELRQELLDYVGAFSIDVQTPNRRTIMLMDPAAPTPALRFDLTEPPVVDLIIDAFAVLLDREPRVISISGPDPKNMRSTVTVILDQGPLHDDLIAFSQRIALLSLIISAITAGLVFSALLLLTVRPMQRLVDAMMRFKSDPENADTAFLATDRSDEVGIAQRELLAMQQAVRLALRQRERLATLGTAVAKINHDIRGILASATLLSERLLDSADPEVQRTGPRILDAVERAARLCSQTLAYTRDGVGPLRRETVVLRDLVDEAADAVLSERAGRRGAQPPVVDNQVPKGLAVVADREQLFRVLCNLCRNAIEADAAQVAVTADWHLGRVHLRVVDDGPGLSPRAVEHLFQPFAGSTKANGTGLGLAIAREVARAHGGEIGLERTGADGSAFVLTLPAAGSGGGGGNPDRATDKGDRYALVTRGRQFDRLPPALQTTSPGIRGRP